METKSPQRFSLDETLQVGVSRRTLLRRAAALGVSMPVVGGLLAACGGGGDDEATTAPQATQAGGGGATPGATEAPSGDSTPATTPSSEAGAFEYEEPQNKGGQIIEGTFADAKTVNPVLVSDTSSGRITDLIFNSVITPDVETTEPKGELAESWEISEDGLTYTFTLRSGVTFHDGEPLTAEDVKFTYDLLMNPASNSPRTAELTERIESIEVTDESTVVFTLKNPTAPFLVSNMVYGIVPQHILQDVDPAELAQHEFSVGTKGVTIGTGPFQFEEWIKDDHMTLVKYPDYWEGEPNIDRFIYKVVPDQTVAVQQLKTGEIDFGPINEASYEEMKAQENVKVFEYDTFTFTFYAYQLDPEKTTLFQDKRVRQALFYALDREAMIEAIRFGLGEVAHGTMPLISWAYNPDGLEIKYEYDPDKAKQLLDEAGWVPGPDGIREKDGQRLAFSVYTNAGNQVREQYITVFQQAWKEIGVECTPKTEEWNAFLDRITGSKDFEMFLVGFQWDVDPDQTTMWATEAYEGGFNMNKYSNPQVDELLKQGLLTTDQEERKRIYTEMQNILQDELPSPVLDFPKAIAGVNKRVHNLWPNAVDTTFNAHQWWVDA